MAFVCCLVVAFGVVAHASAAPEASPGGDVAEPEPEPERTSDGTAPTGAAGPPLDSRAAPEEGPAPTPKPDAPGTAEAPSTDATNGDAIPLDTPIVDTPIVDTPSTDATNGDATALDTLPTTETEHGTPDDAGADTPAEGGASTPAPGSADAGPPPQVDLADPMGPVEAALDELEAQGFTLSARKRSVSALQGEVLTVTISGTESELLFYMFSAVAEDGYQFLLAPTGPNTFDVIVLRARSGQGRGVDLVNVDDVEISGTFRDSEDGEVLRKFAALPPGGVVPVELAGALQGVGYQAVFEAVGPGTIRIAVRPGRALRRVRIRGHVPLSERELRRVLGPTARPGALARGQCVDARTLRKARPASICAPDDLACQRWEKAEVDRVERFLFDSGYLEGRAALGLRCGRDGEADLFVFLKKGRAFRVRHPVVHGNVTTNDQRWIRRMFRSTVSPFIPIGKRITRKHIEAATERVAREYAQPRGRARSATRRQLELPYPGVRVETNFDEIDADALPEKGRTLPLVVDVQVGNGVRTGFIGNEHVAESRLLDQMQLFQRREPPTAAGAAREAENIRRYYQRRGFMFADVDAVYGDSGALKQLTFKIDEGPRTTIRDLGFTSPKDVPPAVMRQIERAYRQGRELADGDRFHDAAARSDLALILTAFAERGYLCARAQMRVSIFPDGFGKEGAEAILDPFTELDAAGHPTWLESQLDAGGLQALREQRRAGVFVRLEVDPGPRVLTSGQEKLHHLELPIPASRDVESIPEAPRGAWGAPRMLRDGALRREGDERAGGIPLQLDLDRTVEREITTQLRNSGYPLANAELRWIYTDPRGTVYRVAQAERLTSASVGMCRDAQAQSLVTIDTELYVHEGRKGEFGTALIRGNFKTKPYLLRREIESKEGQEYDARVVDTTRRHIEGTGVATAVQIREQPTDCKFSDDPERPCVVHQVISMQEAKDRFMDLSYGIGGATLDPFYAFLAPAFPNVGGTGWDIQLDGHYGTNSRQLSDVICEGEDCFERSARASVLHPRIFGSPLTLDIGAQVQRRVTPARGQIDSLLGTVRFTWPATEHLRTYIGYVVQAANISKDVAKPNLGTEFGCGVNGDLACRRPNRSEAIVPDLTGGIEIGAQYQDVDNAFNPDDGFIATADLLYADPYLGGRDRWIRAETSWQHFIPLPRSRNRLNFRYMLRYGHAIPIANGPNANTTSIPEVWRFFGGGTADLGVRGIEPQTLLVDIEEIQGPYGTLTLRPAAQGGHIRALGTMALQVVSVPKFLGGKIAHSVFIDAGVLTQRWRQVVPIRDIRRSVGLNFIKWDISIVTVALGYAVLVPNAILRDNVRPTDDQNGRFVFDVGATF